MNPAILVGRRPDNGHRDELWAWCRARWEAQLGWPIYEGLHLADESPHFSLSAASNRAAAQAAEAGHDTYVYIGGDWFAGTARQVETAARLALETGKLWFAHDRTVVLTESTSKRLRGEDWQRTLRDWPLPPVGRHPTPLPSYGDDAGTTGMVHPNTYSGVLAVERELWERVGGFDERFVGWGWDDLAFWSACCGVAGYERIADAAIYHLWHPQDRAVREEQPFSAHNEDLGRRYLDAKWNAPAIDAILREPGGPLA